jgi:putative ABC transport system substrate-binding protein
MPVIGYLDGSTESAEPTAAIRRGIAEFGYAEGRNVEILYRWAENRYDRLPSLAMSLGQSRAAVIIASGNPAAVAAKAAITTIPIVFAIGGDPVDLGLVVSLNRPGGTITGVSFLNQTLVAKRLELLHEILPAATPIGFLVNPTSPQVVADIRQAETAARILGVHLIILNASSPTEIEAAFAMFVGAIMVQGDTFLARQAVQLATLAAHYAVPAIYPIREFVDVGGLMSYGASIPDALRLAGTYAGRILKGEKPADLPVQQSTYIDIVLNLKTAKTLGIEVPTATLLRATEVIE